MKSLLKTAAITSAFLLAPMLALAQGVNATANIGVKPPSPAEVLRQIQTNASTTRAEVQVKLDAAQTLIEQRHADIQLLIERKRAGTMSSTSLMLMEQKRIALQAEVQTKKAEAQVRTEAARAKAQEKFGEAVQTSVGNIVDRLTKAAGSLTSIADRIDNRIKEYEAQDKDMTVSITLLVDSRTAITAAQDKVAAVGTALSDALASTNPKDNISKVRAAVKAAEDSLKKAKESLQKTLESVRTESAVSADATTTTTVTN